MITPFAAPLPGLAPRTVRLAAVLVDALVTLPVVLLWAVAAGGSVGLSLGLLAHAAAQRPWLHQAGTVFAGTLAWVVFAVATLGLIWLTLYQWFLLSTRGQTVGKRLVGIRIVTLEGKPAGFVDALLLRTFVFLGLMSALVGLSSILIPFAGAVLWALDYVPAFGEDRRCLHDYLAGTQVRWVRESSGRVFNAVLAVTLTGVVVGAALERDALMRMVKPAEVPPVSTVALPVIAAPAAEPKPVPSEDAKPSPPLAEKAAEVPPVEKSLYQFTDDQGVVHVTDDLSSVPAKFRPQASAP